MNKPTKEGKQKVYASYGLLVLIFFVDCFLSFNIFGGIPYVIGLVLVMWLLPSKEMVRFGIVCGVVALLGFFSPASEITDNMGGLMTRFMAIFTVIALALFARRESDMLGQHKEQEKLLNSVIDKRTSGLKQVVDQFEEVKIRLAEAEQLGHFGFWEYHPGSRNMIWSNGVFGIYGYPITPQAPSIQDFLNQTHIEDMSLLQDSIESTLSEKKASTAEYRITMPDGSFKWIYYRGRPVLDKDGNVENIVGTIQDITFQKQSEHQIDVNTAKYTTLFKSASVPKALFIPDKRIIEVNNSFCRWVGYHEKELLKIPIEKLMHKDDRSMDDAYARDIVQGDLDVYRKEKRFVRKNGQTVWGLLNVAAVLDSNDKILYFSAEVIDITRLKAAEIARQKAEDAWKEAEAALNEFEADRRLKQLEGDPQSPAVQNNPDYELELEKAYEMAEEVIENVFGISNDMLAIIGEDRLYKRLSPGLLQLLGFKPGELEEQRIVDTIHQQDQPRFHAYLDLLFSGEKTHQIKVRHNTAHGAHEWILIQASFNRSHEVAYCVFQTTEPEEVSYEAEEVPASPSQSYEKAPTEVHEQAEFRNGQHKPRPEPEPVFREPKEPTPPHRETSRRIETVRSNEDSYPTLEEQLQQLYGEVDPSSVTSFDDPQDTYEEPPYRLDEAPEEDIDFQDHTVGINSSVPVQEEEPIDSLDSDRSFFEDEPYDPNPQPYEENQPYEELQAPEFIGTNYEEDSLRPNSESFIGLDPVEEPLEDLSFEESPTVLDASDEDSDILDYPEYDHARHSHAAELHEPLDHLYEEDPVESEPVSKAVSPKPRPTSDIPWRQLTDKIPFLVWMLDEARQCKYANKKLRDFTGLPFEQLEGTGWSKTIHPEDYRKYVNYSRELVSQRNPVGFAYRMRRADGIHRWMQETSIPLFDRAEHFEGYLATSLDISKLKRVGAQFSKALEATINLEDIHSSMVPCFEEESTYAITESVKVADALINNAREMPQDQLATLMNLAGQRMLGLVNGMLAFSNIRPRKTNLMHREVAVRDSISSIVEMLTPLRRTGGPRFQVDEKSKPFMVLADKVLLHRILETLIRSLQDYAESRVITIDFGSRGDFGTISIGHIGPILTDSFLHQLSDLYREPVSLSLYQRKSGLHLSLIKKLVEVMNGSLIVSEINDVGPVITIRLKLADAYRSPAQTTQDQQKTSSAASTQNATRPTRPAVSRSSQEPPVRARQTKEYSGNSGQLTHVANAIDSISQSKTRIPERPSSNGNGDAGTASGRHRLLIGEQNKDTQRLIRSLLQADYDLSIVPSVEDFFKQADDSAFDLFLLDIHMQSGDGRRGVDILRELRSRPQYRRTPVIAVASGNSGADKSELIERGGFDDFLRKPFSIVELLETVEKMIDS